ncbi:hypothetical protein SELMODRAFT_88028 [Selaginella moellendorffii]|uniref:Glutaredoxin domain-containing protein n=1 Tax=Selaginella moellendorffii TaxID=88036 RepID=D8R9Q2_SELML|nr:hypothetical protein SELMODRAFT_88028 [Selaginella moellendorffii]
MLSQEAPQCDGGQEENERRNFVESFQQCCPPGGESSVVLYCTSLRGIRKTYEDCRSMQMLFRTLGINIDERDVSMHSGFRTELRQLLGAPVGLPRVFIGGRFIGGAEEVRSMHEQGNLARLLQGMVSRHGSFLACDGCGGMRFVPCRWCRGSCKLFLVGGGGVKKCPHCNENGIVRCPICSSPKAVLVSRFLMFLVALMIVMVFQVTLHINASHRELYPGTLP